MTVHDLPALNATLNAIAALLLVFGFIFIKRGSKVAHRNCMIAAFVTSSVFLVCYVTHKILIKGAHTPFAGEGFVRKFYYAMLISHIVLAMAIVPMALITISRALKARYEQHKKIARWTWPIWMYVSITGVLIYLLLYQVFPQH